MHVPCSSSLTLYWDRPFEETYTDAEGTPEYQRRKAVRITLLATPVRVDPSDILQVFDNDPMRTTPLTACIGARLREAETACGGGAELQSRYLAKAEPLLLKQVWDALNGALP